MTLLKFFVFLFSLGIVTIIVGVIIARREVHKENFWIEFDRLKHLIENLELSQDNHDRINHGFDKLWLMRYVDKKAYKSLWTQFMFRFKDYSTIVIKPDYTDDYYNYKILVE